MLDARKAQDVAVEAAQRAGEVIRRGMATARLSVSRLKSPGDIATAIDAEAEDTIRKHLLAAYPDHAILGEEQGQRGTSPYRWIVDPLDGTMNFVHGLPYFAVSLALEVQGQVRLAVVLNPVSGELYTAREGEGAYRNGERLQVSGATRLEESLVGTVVPPPTWPEMPDYLRRFCAVSVHAAGVRRLGAAALDLAGVAAGWLDGFFVMNLKLWDVAAGGLLVREAGGLVAALPGTREKDRDVRIVAAGPGIIEELRLALA
jgi:myo-inositol-1(or 4)-monophosphatase